SCDPGSRRDIGESAVSVIAVENAASILSDVEIGEAIGVVIAHRNTHSIAAACDTRLRGYVSECAITIVAIKSVPQRLSGCEEIARPAINQINVHPAIAVIVEECATCAGGFGEIFLRRRSGDVRPADAAGRRGHFGEWIAGRI